MKFAYGSTRWVFLIGPYAFKIARLRPLWWPFRLIQRIFQKAVARRLSRFHGNPGIACAKYLSAGFLANGTERRLWEESRDSRLAPTLFSFLGILNIQPRGEAVSEDSLEEFPFRELARGAKEGSDLYDLTKAKQFARFGDEILLIDYGGEDFARRLAEELGPRRLISSPAISF
jgi:hypothetical protein